MLILNTEQTRAALPWGPLIEAVEAMFRASCIMPARHHHEVTVPGGNSATLLLMPAWVPGAHIGVKLVTVFPDNHLKGLPAIFGSYILSSGTTGEMLAVMDGGELTARRTAAASAVAARYLADDNAETMLMVGTGRLSLNVMEAHASVRPLRRFLIWGRNSENAERTAEAARALGLQASATGDLESAARQADIISCATLSSEPLILGEWLKPGAHLDLIGAFKPGMRESDDRAVTRARLFVDTREGVLSEGGDIIQPLRRGLITEASILGDLADLATGRVRGRTGPREITLFKSVGAALEDLAGAVLAYQGWRNGRAGSPVADAGERP